MEGRPSRPPALGPTYVYEDERLPFAAVGPGGLVCLVVYEAWSSLTRWTSETRHALLCAGAVVTAALAAGWSYSYTARKLVRTGQIRSTGKARYRSWHKIGGEEVWGLWNYETDLQRAARRPVAAAMSMSARSNPGLP